MSTKTRSTHLRAKMVLLVIVTLFWAISPSFAQKRIALVVGNDAYENVTKLKKAANDARGMGETLTGLGFEVTTLTNVSRRQMNRKLQEFTNSIDEGDTVLFFFAGHGVEIDGENFLLPIDVPDANSDQLEFIKAETIRLNTVLADLRERKSQLNLVILDACRNNPFGTKAGRSLGSSKGLARISAPQGTFVMYSADVGETALDRLSDQDASPNSVFTRTLIPLMKTPGMDLVDTARKARRQVRTLALGVSHEQTPAYYDAVLGDFYFTPPGTTNVAPTVPLVDIKPVTPQLEVAILPDDDAVGNPLRPLAGNEDDYVPALAVSAGEKDLIRLWDMENMQLLAELNGEKKLFSTIKLINKGHALLVAGLDGSVVSYALPSFKKTNAFYPQFEVSALAQSDDGTLMVGGNDGLLVAYDGKTFQEIWRRQAHDGIVSPIIPVGGEVVSASGDGAIVTTDIATGRETGRIHSVAGGKVTDIAFVNSNTVVAVHEKGRIAYINLASGKILNAYKGHNGWISSVDVTPDGSAIVTAGVNGNLKFWALGSASQLHNISAHSDVASGAKFLAIGKTERLLSAGFDGVLRLWDKDGNRQITTLKHGPAILHFDYVSTQ